MGGAVAVVTASLAATGGAVAQSPGAEECNVGVSWNNFQQRRWAATDKPNMQTTIEEGGGTFADADADLDTEQQLTDVNTLIEQGADVLVLLAQDLTAIGPAVQAAKDAGIPIIAYDRLVEDPDVLYITFDNVGVGRAEAEAMFAKVPTGNYVLIKGDPGDPNASTFLPQGWDEAGLADKVASGEITIEADQFTPAWDTQTAQNNMEAIIQGAIAADRTIDAVLAENDSTALGVVAALVANGLEGVPVSGQDGDPANLNNVAKGLQYVDVWKNSNELGKVAGYAALQLCAGVPMGEITLPEDLIDPGVVPTAGLTASDFTTPGGNTVKSFILGPTPITAENLQLVLDGGWIDLATLCDGVTAEMPGAAVCEGAPAGSPAASPAESPAG
jgi:D-xylose transport system substrate-binding protein